jgi:type II secretion system protein D
MRFKVPRGAAAAILLIAGAGPALAAAVATAPASAYHFIEAQGAAPPGEAAAPPATVRFNFKGATFDEVLDFFSRATGLPVIRETDVPQGTIDYLSPEQYELPEALRVLNIILQSRGVMLRVQERMLYLQKLTEMQRESLPVFVGELPEHVTSEEIVTVVRPLEIALAKPLAERLALMVAAYGAVASLDQQNALVITETAGQVRRLLSIIEELDREDPEGVIEIFSIRHARAADLMGPLKALLGQKVEKYVINQQGQQVKIEEEALAGLNISHDERTNSIIAKGVQSRIDKLREAIAMLDLPASNGGRSMRTLALLTLAPKDAAARLEALFAKLPEAQRPTIVPHHDAARITVVGADTAVYEAAQLLKEIDGGASADLGDGSLSMSVLSLEHAEPPGMIAALTGLLNGRQLSSTKLVAGPDGRSIIISGPAGDVVAVKSVIAALDRPGRVERQVRLLRLGVERPQELVERARALYEQQTDRADPARQLDLALDADARVLTLIGGQAALERFGEILRQLESNTVVQRETRQLNLAAAEPTAVAASLRPLARAMLQPRDGGRFEEPHFEPIDPLDLLLVTAEPDQFPLIESLAAAMDRPDPSDYQFRVIGLAGVERPADLLARTEELFQRLRQGHREGELPAPEARIDPGSGQLVVSGRTESVGLFEQALAEARRLLPPARSGRMLALRQGRAADVAAALQELLATTAPVDPARQVPAPRIDVVERTNSLYVVAEEVQHALIERYVRELDTFELTELPPLRLIQVRAADATQLAGLLRQRYEQRPPEMRRQQPVDVSADAGTNTLIVVAHEDVFQEIRTFVDDVNRSGETGPERETMIFALKRARSTDLAQALDKLYPQPPMPQDARGRPLPHLQKPKEVHVSADPATNTLIIEAPVERRESFEALVEQLDRVELPPTAQLRTWHIERGDVSQIARTLSELARQGVMSRLPEDGSKPVQVTIQAETQSSTLIVAGDEVTFQKTDEVLRDLQAVPLPRSLRVFEVVNADPEGLAQRALRLYEQQTAQMPDAGPVDVEVDRDNGILLVVADDQALVRFAGIVNQLQETIGAPADVRLHGLEYARARELVTFIEDLLAAPFLAAWVEPRPVLQAIERTNSIVVAARAEQHPLLEAIIEALDVVENQQMPPLRILQLRTADAQNLADALMRQYNQRPIEQRATRPVSLAADPQTNALMVAAHPEVLPEIEAIVRELNDTTRMDSEGREIRIFPLAVARAEELARTIDEMFPEPPVPLDARGRPLPHLRQPREVVVRADPQTNSLIVDGPVQRMAGFDKLVEQLDRQKIVEETEVRTYPIRRANLDAVAGALRQLASGGTLSPAGRDRRVPVTVNTEPVSRTLIVAGPSDAFDRVEQVIGDLDAPRQGPATTLRFFRLERARADGVAEMLRQVLLSRIEEDVPEAGADVQSLLNVSADRKTNTLIISAPAAIMPLAEEVVRQLDAGATALGDPVVRVRPLTFADAREVSGALAGALAAMISPVTGEPMAVRFTAAGGSNALIMVGLPGELDEVDKLVEPLDARPATDAMDARTFRLEHAEASRIAPIVQRLLTDQQETDPRIILERIRRSRGQIDLTPKIRVEADERTNSLIVSGPQPTVSLAESLVAELDRPDESASASYAVYTVTNGDPAVLARSVQEILEASRPQGRRSTLRLRPDPASSTVVVIGQPQEQEEALALLERSDRDVLQAPQVDLRVVNLRHSEAAVVARAVGPMLADESRWPQPLRAARRAGLPLAQPTVTADGAANRILISAPAELMDLAAGIVERLDAPAAGAGAVDVRIFNLQSARADEVAAALGTALAARRVREPGLPPANVAAEPSSNSVIVTAAAGQLEEVQAIIESLDRGAPADQVQVRTVFLEHARAESVAPIVEQLLSGEDVPFWMRAEAVLRNRPLPEAGPDVRVAADQRLNAIVVSAPPAVLNVAEQMIAQLDVPPGGAAAAALRSVRVLVVENADAAELARTLEGIFAEPDQAEPAPTLRVDAASNSLVVRATAGQFRTIEDVVGAVDRATVATGRQIRMIPIDPARGSAEEIARTLQRLLDRGRPGRVEVIPLEDLLKRKGAMRGGQGCDHLARGAGHVREVAPFRGGVWTALLTLAPAVVPEDPAAEPDFTIAVDPRTNSLVIVGSPRAVERAAALAAEIERQVPPEPASVRIVALPESMDAASLAQLVNQTVQRMGRDDDPRGNLARRVGVLPDRASNALIVVAADPDFQSVAELIAAFSTPMAAEQVLVKVYPLRTITAERAISSVEALIGAGAAGPEAPRGPGRQQAQRMRRNVELALLAGGRRIEAVFDPQRLRLSSDAQTNSLVVVGPPEAIGFIDQYVELIDQTPVNVQATLKVYPLRHARADDLDGILQRIFRARFRNQERQVGTQAVEPEIVADGRSNLLLVTASPEALAEIDGLVQQLDQRLGQDIQPLRILELSAARPTEAAALLDRVVVGTNQDRRASTAIVPDDNSGMLLVRAAPDVMEEIERVLAEVDRDATRQFAVRTITLARAKAAAVAQALQRFFDDRARIASSGRGRREQARRVSIIGDPASNTLLVAASDEDFGEIEKLVAQFDTPQAAGALAFRVFPLRHAKAREIQSIVQELVNDLTWNQGDMFFFWPFDRGGRDQGNRDRLAVRGDDRLNALIVTGSGDKFELVEQLIGVLDAPRPEGAERVVRLYRVQGADVDVVLNMVRSVYSTAERRRWWEPVDPSEIRIEVDRRTKTLIIAGSPAEHTEIAALIAGIDRAVAPADQSVQVLAVRYGRADELARTLQQFLSARASAMGAAPPAATVLASASTNGLVVSAGPEEMATIRDLLDRLDKPDVSGDRVVEIVVLKQGDADQIARIVKEQFGRRGAESAVVTADARTNSIIINAPAQEFTQAKALIERLDSPSASDETIVRFYALRGARAQEVVDLLTKTLQLDATGETKGITVKLDQVEGDPVEVQAKVVADRRSNSLVVTATAESFPIIEALIEQVDQVPAASPREWRVYTLQHARAFDVYFTLRQFVRSQERGEQPEAVVDYNTLENQVIVAAGPDQFEQFEAIIKQVDVASPRQRVTEFVPLRFAEAEKVRTALGFFYGDLAPGAQTPAAENVRIVADTATNSLVISAEESEWDAIRSLLTELDSEEYDASLQLRVLPLVYADARSVARAINDAFEGEIDRSRRGRGGGERAPRERREGGADERREPEVPALLVESEEWVRASAEPLTNSLVVSASRQNLAKIEEIVRQLDVADFAKLPPPQIIRVHGGDPVQLAESLRRLYEQSGGDQQRQGLRIVGDKAANTIIVRAQPEEFAQIRALAEAVQQEAASQGLSVQVIRLSAVPARRVADAIEAAFQKKAEQSGQPLSIQVDALSNALVVACTAALFAEIAQVAQGLDQMAPAAGQGIFIIELQHVSPEAARRVIEEIGLHQPQPEDSVSRLVSEPIKVMELIGRNAILVVANPADREAIVGLLKALDAEPVLAEARMRVVRLRRARAEALVDLLTKVLDPAQQQAATPLAQAVQEQVRRLAVRRDGLEQPDVTLDLTRPIRLIADQGVNALLISSTEANVAALEQLVAMFDELPITDAVTVQVFPLQNIAAEQFARIVDDLFQQGQSLATVPITNIEAVPSSTVGRALLERVAIAVDERTNTVVVAGKEEAVALVEVLSKRLDSDVATGWVEPRVVPLRFADAGTLAELLRSVLVDGVGDMPQSNPLQRQVGRLRMALGQEPGQPALESDVYQPMTRLLIQAEPQLNALVLVGTPANLDVVAELARMFDVEAASPSAVVRVYPVNHASASRLAETITRLFDQQVQSKAIRPEDRVSVQADVRTNALIVTTSPRSFTVLERLLESLDAVIAPDLREIRRIDLRNASASRLAGLIQTLMDARLERLRRVQPETADLERATIVADTRTNSLVVAAGNESFDVIQRLAQELDDSSLLDHALVEVIALSGANADRLADTIGRIMERRYAEMPADVRASQRPLILTDPRTNSLLVAASPEDVGAIRDLVARLEAAPVNPAVGLHVLALESSRADEVAPRLQRLMRERQQTLGDAQAPSDRVVVEADPASNSLIVAASEENFQVVRGLLEALTAAGSELVGSDAFEVLQLSSSRASDVVDLLDDLYVAEENRRRGDNTVRVTADERLNALLVNAPPADIAAIRRLVAQLDGSRPSQIVEIKYIPLSGANALETVSLIQNILSGRGIGARQNQRQATVLKYLRHIAEQEEGRALTEMEVSAAIRESIVLTPDVRTNTVIVSAPRESMAMIEQMVRDLDQTNVGSQSIRIFKLQNADAGAMAQILTELFSLERRGNLYVLRPREAVSPEALQVMPPGTPPAVGLEGTELTAVPDERQQLSITVDSRTNSLLVSGTPTYLDLVGNVVEELDAMEANERAVFIYQLRNSTAADVARVVRSFIDTEQQKLIGTLGADQIGSAARLLEREVTIVDDVKSNSVLVSVSPRYQERIRQIIEELDIDPPQVLIQVLLAEVTLDSSSDWGVDLQAVGRVSGADIAAGFGFASAFVSGMGVPQVAVAAQDFNLLVRALETQGRLQVLSNPSVMAANNQPARIQVGETIRVPEATSFDQGSQQTSVIAEDIGIILNVTPSINPDGFVRMEVKPEISELSDRTTRISEDFESPIITRRSAETTVTVKDGQTIVIGGLISDRYEKRQRMVPFLGEIPLFGALFRNDTESSIKTELLIVLTPYVIASPAEVDLLTDSEVERLSLPAHVKEEIRRSRLEGRLLDSQGKPIGP